MSKYNRRLLRRSIQEQIQSIRQRASHADIYAAIELPSGNVCAINFRDESSWDSIFPDEAYEGVTSREAVFNAIDAERQYQHAKWGSRPQTLPGYLLILERELQEAKDGWMKNSTGRDAPLAELIQVAAVAVAALEAYGLEGTTFNGEDQPNPKSE